nr:hypothetical protein [Tanacetum cinerariifolium]
MAALPIGDELRRTVNSVDWEPQFILYCQRAMGDDVRLARQINALCGTLTEVIKEKENFVVELDMLAGKFVPGKMAEFMKEMLGKDIAGQKRALFADVSRGMSDSSLVFAAPVTCIFLCLFVCFILLLLLIDQLQRTPLKHLERNLLSFLRKIASTGTSLLQELARAIDYDDIRDQLSVLFTKETLVALIPAGCRKLSGNSDVEMLLLVCCQNSSIYQTAGLFHFLEFVDTDWWLHN